MDIEKLQLALKVSTDFFALLAAYVLVTTLWRVIVFHRIRRVARSKHKTDLVLTMTDAPPLYAFGEAGSLREQEASTGTAHVVISIPKQRTSTRAVRLERAHG